MRFIGLMMVFSKAIDRVTLTDQRIMFDPTRATVIIRDWNGMRQLQAADSWTTITLMGALSADPRSFDELARAWWRYQPEMALEDLPWAEGVGGPADGPWLLLERRVRGRGGVPWLSETGIISNVMRDLEFAISLVLIDCARSGTNSKKVRPVQRGDGSQSPKT